LESLGLQGRMLWQASPHVMREMRRKKVGRALHGAGAEGVPRSASTAWSVMA